jgi:putative transcriptional regulator
MTISHHPAEPTLLSYASGTLPVAISGLVACHVSLCPQCRERVRWLTMVAGVLLEGLETPPMSELPAQRLEALAMTDEPVSVSKSAPPAEACTSADEILPKPLAHYLGMTAEELPWRTLVKGLEQYKVKLPRGSGEMRILRTRPKLRLPKHSHRGMELTLVLKGAYRDETGEYHRGDVSDLGDDIEHQPKVWADSECICIIASERPARYSDLMLRILQPIMDY